MQDDDQGAAAPALPAGAAPLHAQATAEHALAWWRRVDAALSPVVGHGGVAALYRRSLFLVRAERPWLPGVREGALDPVEFTSLQAAIALQADDEAAAASQALQRTFHDLLVSLVGSSLTERLLRPPPKPPSNGDAVQDLSS
jgi:hypothetical protein